MMIGMLQWTVTLGRFDIQYATSLLSRFSNAPREKQWDAVFKVFGFLKKNPSCSIVINPKKQCFEVSNDNYDWSEQYLEAYEEILRSVPPPQGEAVDMAAYKDSSHADDLVNCHSLTGYIIVVNSTIVETFSKKQKQVASATYGAEFVAL